MVYGGLPPETRSGQAKLFNDPKKGRAAAASPAGRPAAPSDDAPRDSPRHAPAGTTCSRRPTRSGWG